MKAEEKIEAAEETIPGLVRRTCRLDRGWNGWDWHR